MVKYARIVFEVEVEDNASEEEVLDTLEETLQDFVVNPWGMDDVEIHSRPYIQDECNSDVIE